MTHYEEREGSDEVLDRGPCDDCGSDNNLVTYQDGHRFCYSPDCGPKGMAEGFSAPPKSSETKTKYKAGLISSVDGDFSSLDKRGLKDKTLRRFGYFRKDVKNGTIHVAPYYSQQGDLVIQKTRDKDKGFACLKVDDAPALKDCMMFGQQVWGDRFDRKIIVTEGELDAMSVAQAMDFKVPAVSISAGVGSAVRCLKNNYRWLDSFDEIIFWFDNDEPGQEAIAECASLFQVGKVKTIKVDGYKDASDLLGAKKSGDIYTAVWSALSWKPDGIVNAAQCTDDMDEEEPEILAPYPFPLLNEHLGGLRLSEVVYHVAGTGIGKTSIFNEIIHPTIMHGVKVGIMRFEDVRRKAQIDLMSIHANRRLHLEQTTPDYRKKLHAEVFGAGNVELFDPTTAEWGFESIKSYIRFMVKALGCQLVFLDPLSFIVAGMDVKDERIALDRASRDLALLAKELNVGLHISHHLTRPDGRSHEEGGQISLKHIRGSGGVAMFASAVIGYERDQQGKRSDLTLSRLLKNRDRGTTGTGDVLKFNPETGRLIPTDEEYPDPNDDNNNGGGPSGFPTGEY